MLKLKMNERINLISALEKHRLDLKLLQEFEPGVLLKLCGNLDGKQTPQSWYVEYLETQKELIKHERFFFLFGTGGYGNYAASHN